MSHMGFDALCGNANIPTVLFGDFNEITGLHEKYGGAIRGERAMDAFRSAIDDCGMVDLGFKGNIFTWQRGNSVETVVKERLDKYMANNSWCTMFQFSEVIHFPIYKSDHARILLKFGRDKTRHRKGKLFQFESLWLSNDECEKVVGNAWKENVGDDIHSRVSGVANSLACWARVTFGDIQKRILAAERDLHNLQEKTPDGRIIERMHQVTNALDELYRLKES